jgi:hypothetical protein
MNPGAGNRQDNRQRGNAAQLLEKYKGLARDAQMQGDRVQTEYYLQFADHYYRILNENRARFEEQRRQRGEGGYDASYDEEDQDELETAGEGRERDSRDDRGTRETREPRDSDDGDEPREVAARRDREPRDQRRQGNGEYRGRRYRGRSNEEGDGFGNEASEAGAGERIAADILPPSIGPVGADEGSEEPRAPRRRPRRPREEPGEEIAPAA